MTVAAASLAQAALIGSSAFAALTGGARAETPVQIEGVENGDRRNAIRALLPDRDAPETEFDAERIAEEAAGIVRDWLRSEGWYQGAAFARVATETLAPSVEVVFGPRFTFAEPVLDYSGQAVTPEADAAVREALSIVRPGEPAEAGVVLAAEQAAVAALRARGYPEAEAGHRLAVVDHETEAMRVTFRLLPGSRATLGAVRLAADAPLKRAYLDKLVDWEPGKTPYSPNALIELRRDLTATAAFSQVGAELAPAEPGEPTRDVLLSLRQARPFQLSLGASYSTTEGAGGAADFLIRNITKRADALTLTLIAAEQEQSLGAAWRRPNAVGRGRALVIEGLVGRDDTIAFERTGVRLGVSVEPRAFARFAPTYGGTLSVDFFDDASGGVSNAVTTSLFAGLRYDTTDNRLDPRSGVILEAREQPAVSTGDATLIFARTTGTARGFWTPGRGDLFTLAGRLSLGWVQPLLGEADRLPLDQRFYAGGGGSVRGYPFQSLFPVQRRRDLAQAPGGQGLYESSVEGRFRLTQRLGAALFVDTGTAFDTLDEFSPAYGVGAGLRYDLGFGPLRIDIATPLSDVPGAGPVAFYFSVGQAF